MKSIYSFAFLLTMISCSKVPSPTPEPDPTPDPTNKHSKFWGCWKEINNNPNCHDLKLEKNDTLMHGLAYADECINLTAMHYFGVFRNDTLVFNNGFVEEYFSIKEDTLTNGSLMTGANDPIRFVKVQ